MIDAWRLIWTACENPDHNRTWRKEWKQIYTYTQLPSRYPYGHYCDCGYVHICGAYRAEIIQTKPFLPSTL